MYFSRVEGLQVFIPTEQNSIHLVHAVRFKEHALFKASGLVIRRGNVKSSVALGLSQ